MWEGTPGGDCADRPLGTPRDGDPVCCTADAYVVFCDCLVIEIEVSVGDQIACVLEHGMS